MPDPRETLARIRKQADAATEGPWDYQYGYDTPSEWQDSYVLDEDGESVVSDTSDENGEFIAAARTNVPRLVDVLEAVLELHKRQPSPDGDFCAECFPDDWDYPCPTVTTITTALEGEAHA